MLVSGRDGCFDFLRHAFTKSSKSSSSLEPARQVLYFGLIIAQDRKATSLAAVTQFDGVLNMRPVQEVSIAQASSLSEPTVHDLHH